MRKGETTAFIEVKARATLDGAVESVSPRQARRISAAARSFLGQDRKAHMQACRFDIVAVSPYHWPRHIANAFDERSIMALNIGVQMDPIQSITIRGDSTFAMMLEAQARGHKLFYYQTKALALGGGSLFATATTSPCATRRATTSPLAKSAALTSANATWC